MSGTRGVRLRLGVVGLGRLWEGRHRPALLRMAERCRVTAVYDQVSRRAQMEADSLRCAAPESLAALVGREDVDAVYLLSPQWFGLHAARLASAAGKAIYFGLPVAGDPEGLEVLARELGGASQALFVPELARRFYPATLRLKELLASRLGSPRLVVGQARLFGFDRYGVPGPTTQLEPLPMAVDPGANLVDWCRYLFDAEPVGVQAYGTRVLPGQGLPDDEDSSGYVLEFPGGGQVQVSLSRYHREAWGPATDFLPSAGLQVYAERGVAWLELPDRLQWTDGEAKHEERLPLEPNLGVALNDHFFRRVNGEQSLAPGLADALSAARLVRALQLSRREGRRVDTPTVAGVQGGGESRPPL